MTRADRLKLIMQPFPVVRTLTTCYPHAGTLVRRPGFGLTRTAPKRPDNDDESFYSHFRESEGFVLETESR